MFGLKSIFFVIVAIVAALAAIADDSLTPKEALAMEMIEVTEADKMIEALAGQFEQQMQRKMEAQISCPAQREVAAEFADSFASTLGEMMRSSELKADLILAYAELFTLDELQALVEFHRSELGRKLLEVQPEIMRRSMKAGQRMMSEMQSKMLEASATFEVRMKEVAGSCD